MSEHRASAGAYESIDDLRKNLRKLDVSERSTDNR